MLKETDLREFKQTIQYQDGSSVTLERIQSAIQESAKAHGVPLGFGRDEIKSINDSKDVKTYAEALCEKSKVISGSGMNQKIHGFNVDVNKIIFKSSDVVGKGRVRLC